MQQAIEQFNKRTPDPLAVRIGMSLGEVTEDNGDYFGDAVVQAARLCAIARGGQILATQLVQLTAGRRARQEFDSVGDLELKGLPAPVPSVEVRWAPSSALAEGVLPLPRRCTPTPTAGFVGRTAERAVLADALKKVTSEGRHHLVLIGGEPGMGKTSLAIECAQAAYQDGAIVLFGRADEDLAVPYGPWAEAFTHLVTHAPQSLLDSLSPYAGPLVRIVPPLASKLDGSDTSMTTDPEAARYILFAAVASALAATGKLAPVVLILDDLQWADAPSLQLLRHLAASSEPMRILVVGTFRESDVVAGHPLADLLGALHRESGTERIALRGLDDLELLAMMEGAAGQAMDEDGLALRDALVSETDGNPFFAGELLRHLVETGGIFEQDGRWVASSEVRTQGLPVSVREVIGRRVARLGEVGTRALAIASVIGRDFDLSRLAAASKLDEDTLLDIMDQAVSAALVDNVGVNRYSFVHALIEHTLYDSLSPTRRARQHRGVAEAIEVQARGRTEGRVAELAYHWAQAAVPEDLGKAVHYAEAAADEALARLAPDEAARWYAQALALLEHRPNDPGELRCRLLVGLGNAERQSGNRAYRETLLEAARLAQDLGATEILVAAALANNRGVVSVSGWVDVDRVAALEAACDAVEGTGSAEEARLLAQLARELTYGGDYPRRKALADRALAIARQGADPATLVGVINTLQQAIEVPETLPERVALTAEAFEAAQGVGDAVLEYWTALYRSVACVQAGEADEADAAVSLIRDIVGQLAQPTLRWALLLCDGGRAMLAGDLEEAERLAGEAAEVASATGQPDGAVFFAAQIGYIRVMQGRSGEIVDLLQQAAADNPDLSGFSALLALIYCDLDRPDDARSILEPFVATGFGEIPRELTWLASLCITATAVAELGWVEAAEPLFKLLQPFADQIPYLGPLSWSRVSHALGLLAATLGRRPEAEVYFSQAAETHERIGATWALAMTRLAWGRFLAAGGDPADQARASALLRQALDPAQGRGYQLVERRALQVLGSLDSL